MKTLSIIKNSDILHYWLIDLFEKQEITLLYKAFYSIVGEDASENLEVKEYLSAIVAAEVLVQVIGYPTVPPIVDSGKLDQLAAFLTYDQCKLRMIDLALKCVERIQFEITNLEFCHMFKLQESDFILWTLSTNDLKHRLNIAKQCITT